MESWINFVSVHKQNGIGLSVTVGFIFFLSANILGTIR